MSIVIAVRTWIGRRGQLRTTSWTSGGSSSRWARVQTSVQTGFWVFPKSLRSLAFASFGGRSRKPVYRIAVPRVRIPPPPLDFSHFTLRPRRSPARFPWWAMVSAWAMLTPAMLTISRPGGPAPRRHSLPRGLLGSWSRTQPARGTGLIRRRFRTRRAAVFEMASPPSVGTLAGKRPARQDAVRPPRPTQSDSDRLAIVAATLSAPTGSSPVARAAMSASRSAGTPRAWPSPPLSDGERRLNCSRGRDACAS